ncbi:hypothetical protein E2C01_028319 [Portunus trituberculatus]|uniref:Uncharacterized protein n=1 Tax=Portunus trituberculatus TaxID=210409 RepID=A0A5B7ENU4_PORTR|nr:hypothetical protein [Portunus trituberculatus]
MVQRNGAMASLGGADRGVLSRLSGWGLSGVNVYANTATFDTEARQTV